MSSAEATSETPPTSTTASGQDVRGDRPANARAAQLPLIDIAAGLLHLRPAPGGSPAARDLPMNKPVPRLSFVSLGCPKALVDSERILTHLRAEGYELTRRHDGADVVIVNTCGFLDSAKAESLSAIGTALAENGKVIVTGCMGAEPEQIRERFPDVLSITGPQQYESVVAAVHQAVPPAHDPFV